jgi:hypothetical protein
VLETNNAVTLALRGNGYSHVFDDHNDVSLFRKNEAVDQYYATLRDARRQSRPSLFDSGRLDLVALPKWEED